MTGYLEDVMVVEPTPYVIKRSPYYELGRMVALAEAFGGGRPAPRKTKQVACAWNDVQGKPFPRPQEKKRKKAQRTARKKAQRTARKKKRGY
jgi:hypothetical protein